MDRRATVGQVLLAWLAGRKTAVAPSSYVRYEMIVRLQLAGVAHGRVADITAEAIRAHVRTLLEEGHAPATVGQALRILRSALALAEDDGIVDRNEARRVKAPRAGGRVGRALPADQVGQLLGSAREDPLYPLWAVMLGTGLRLGEALGLRWADIDLKTRSLSVTGALRHHSAKVRGSAPRLARVEPKTEAARRIVDLPAFAVAALASLPTDAIYVFHRGHGRPMNPSTVQRRFATLLEAAGLPPMRLHDLRHTYATMSIASGANLDDVKRALGHSSITITSDMYGHLVKARSRQMADAFDAAVAAGGSA